MWTILLLYLPGGCILYRRYSRFHYCHDQELHKIDKSTFHRYSMCLVKFIFINAIIRTLRALNKYIIYLYWNSNAAINYNMFVALIKHAKFKMYIITCSCKSDRIIHGALNIKISPAISNAITSNRNISTMQSNDIAKLKVSFLTLGFGSCVIPDQMYFELPSCKDTFCYYICMGKLN